MSIFSDLNPQQVEIYKRMGRAMRKQGKPSTFELEAAWKCKRAMRRVVKRYKVWSCLWNAGFREEEIEEVWTLTKDTVSNLTHS